MKALRHLRGEEPVPVPPPPSRSSPPHVDWNAMVGSYYSHYGNRPLEQRAGHFHPSSGLLPEYEGCPRTLIFDLLMAPMTPTAFPEQVLRIFDNGHNRHEGLQRVFARMAQDGFAGVTSFAAEKRVSHPVFPIEGAIDAVVGTRQGRYILDFKTKKSELWTSLFEPEAKHIVQVNTYLGLSGDRLGYLIYENKDNQKWLTFPVRYDPDLFRRVLDYCFGVLLRLRRYQIPEYNEKTCKAHWQGCAYVGSCNNHREGKVTLQELDRRPDEVKKRHRLPLLYR